MKRFFILSITIVLFANVNAQNLWNNPIDGTDSHLSNPYTAGQSVNSNLTVSGIGRGTGISGSGANNRYNASGWNTTATLDSNDYFYFTLTPNGGYKINFANFQFTLQSSGSGPTQFALRSSLDNYASNISATIIASGDPGSSNTIPLIAAPFQGITTAITFRLYGYAAGTGGGTLSVNNFTFTGAIALPVNFEKVQATQSGGQLKVQWITTSETNNDHFDVEVSENGTDFINIATLKSKAANGNSTTPLQYEYTTSASTIAIGVFAALLAVFIPGFKKRRIRHLALVTVIIISGSLITSCQKENFSEGNTDGKIFVRIAQIDIDGTKEYSRIIQAIQE